MDVRRKIIRGLFWSGLQTWGSRVIAFGVFLLLARLLDPTEFGVVAMATVVIALLQLPFEQGFDEALVQRSDLEDLHLVSAFWVCIAIGAIASILALLIAPFFEALFRTEGLAKIIACLAPLPLLTAAMKVQEATLRRAFAFKALAMRTLVATLAGGIVGVWAAWQGSGAYSLVWKQLTETSVALIVLWSASSWRPQMRLSPPHLRQLMSFGGHVILTNALDFLSKRVDSLLIGAFLGSAVLGSYTVGQRLFLLVLDLLNTTTNQVAFPLFAQMQNSRTKLAEVFLLAVRTTALLSFPIFAMLAAFGDEIVVLVFGAQWTDAGPILQVLSVGGLLFSFSYYNATVMKALGKPDWVLALVAINAVANLCGFFIAVFWGPIAVAAAFVLRGYLVYPLNYVWLRRLIPLSFQAYWAAIWPAMIASLIACVAALALRQQLSALPPITAIASVVTTGAAIFLIAITLLRPRMILQTWLLVRAGLRRGGAV